MGRVAIKLVVRPEGPDTDLDAIREEIMEMDPEDIEEEPIGFGLSSLQVLIVRDEEDAPDSDDLEKEISGIKGVAEVKTEDVTLL